VVHQALRYGGGGGVTHVVFAGAPPGAPWSFTTALNALEKLPPACRAVGAPGARPVLLTEKWIQAGGLSRTSS